jgi:hypothetical protein
LRREEIGLAVNSMQGRSQNQLHIHIDCIRLDLRRYLARHSAGLSRRWSALRVAFDGHHYRARRLDSRDLHGVDPFRVLAGDILAARADMGNWTLVAIGAKPRCFWPAMSIRRRMMSRRATSCSTTAARSLLEPSRSLPTPVRLPTSPTSGMPAAMAAIRWARRPGDRGNRRSGCSPQQKMPENAK